MANTKILVVEDENIVALDIQNKLKGSGYSVPAIASSGEEAIEKAQETHPDLVLMDIKLTGGIDGIEAAEQIRDNLNIPVIYVTAYADERTLKRAKITEPFGYILKPFEQRELHSSIQMALYKHKIERKLKETKKDWEETFDSVTESITIIDPNYNILRANQVTLKELKLPGDKTIGEKCYRTFYNREEPCEYCELRETLNKKGPLHLEKYNPLLGKTFQHYTYPGFDEKGNISRVIIYRRDITQLKKLQEEIIRTEKIAALGRMASGIAHDFNNALAAILGLTKLLLLQENNSQKIKDIKAIETVSKDAAQMVKRLQEFTGIRRKKEGFVAINLNDIVKDAIEITKPIWKDKAQAEDVTINVRTDLAPIPHISGNPSEIREMLTNMIFNSVDAMPAGGKLTLSSNLSKDKGFVEININDTGMGMSQEVRRKVFDPFFTTKWVTHTGMGLSICYGITTGHGGKIDVKSTEGKGSTFTIRFPISKETGEEIREEIREEIPEKRFKKAKILIIEDEELVRSTLGRILETVGHKVTKASTSKEGLRIFKRGKFNIVFTDLGMAELSGWKVASMVKQINPHMPVVMITGWGNQFSKQRLETSGVDLILSKPFEPDKLKEVVTKALEIKGGARGRYSKILCKR